MKNHIISKFLITCTLVFLSFANRSYSQIEISITFPDTYEYIIDISREKGKEPICIRVKKDFCDSLKLVGSDGSNKNIFPKDTNDQELIYQLPSPSNPELPIYKLWLIKTGVAKDIIIKVNYKDTAPRIVPPTLNTEEDNITEIKRVFSLYGNFDRTRVIYVYDFNKNMSRRGLYKVYKKKTGRDKFEIVVERVNINRETITPRKDVSFMVININRLIYHVFIADTLYDYNSPMPALFNQFFGFDSNLAQELLRIVNDVNKSMPEGEAKMVETGLSEKEIISNLENDIGMFLNSYSNLQNDYIQAYNPCPSFSDCNSQNHSDLLPSLQRIKSAKKDLDNIIAKNDSIISDLQKKIKKCSLDEKNLQVVVSKIADYQKNPPTDPVKQKEEKDLKNRKIELDSLLRECKVDSINKVNDSLITLNKNLLNIGADIFKLPSADSVQKLIIFLNNVVSQNQVCLADNISLHGNVLDIKIDIESYDSITKKFGIAPYKNAPIHLQIPIVGKSFVSFSSGVFATLNKNLLNKTYEWQYLSYNNTVDTTQYTLVESGYTAKPFGLSALGNIEIKLCRNVGLGLSTGIGITIEQEPRFAYLAGGSFFFGDMRQFALTGGFVVMPVDHITETYKAIADNQVIYPKKVDIEYYKEMKIGAFISISYTPFSSVKKNK